MVSAERMRALALSMPEAEEKSHFEHPDFRVRNKIFCTLWPDNIHAVLRLEASERMWLVDERPDVFSIPPGGDRGGWTCIDLHQIEEDELEKLVIQAWRHRAPKRLVAAYDAQADADS